MRRMYLEIYATVVAILIVFALLVALAWLAFGPARDPNRMLAGVANVLARTLPPADAPADEQQRAIEELARDLDVRLTLRDAGGRRLAAVGEELPPPDARALAERAPSARATASCSRCGCRTAARSPRVESTSRSAGRSRSRRSRRRSPSAPTPSFAASRGGSSSCAPRSRRSARATSERASRCAGATRSRASPRASTAPRGASSSWSPHSGVRSPRASHELRSPLARIRVAIELLGGAEGDALRARVARDVAELDALIGELLLASRLDALAASRAPRGASRSTCSAWLRRRRRARAPSARAKPPRCRATRPLAAARSQPARERPPPRAGLRRGGRSREAGARGRARVRVPTAAPGSRRASASASSSPSTGRRARVSRRTAATDSDCLSCARSRDTTAARRAASRGKGAERCSKSSSEVQT